MADYLSRQHKPPHPLPTPIVHLTPSSHPNLFFWLDNPTLNWHLPFLLLDDLRSHLHSPLLG
jgi:hypothetical protein